MKFTKMHGCGNDYIFINCLREEVEAPSLLAKRLSDRHFGIGADGLVLILPSDSADYYMRMYNADGSIGEMCGNAIRCVAKYVYENHLTDKTELSIDTGAGIRKLSIVLEGESVKEVKVDMGMPIMTPQAIPVLSERNIVVEEPITILGERFLMTCISMGNPHAVVFVDQVQSINLNQVGIPFEHNLRFPNRTNVEFVQLLTPHTIRMRVWERGSGETLACGTGACAAVVAGVLTGRLQEHVLVKLPGGELFVHYDQDLNRVFLTGPATFVFEGEVN